jgi:site-specific recombinase XerD
MRRDAGEERIFGNLDGSPFSLWQLHERLGAACRRAGLREVRWHDLRHSFASQLVSAGVLLRQIQEWLGHSTMTMTMRHAHLAPGSGHEIRVLDRATFGQNLAKSQAKVAS